MLVAVLVILASVLALGLLSFLDNSQASAIEQPVAREHKAVSGPVAYYDAFSDSRTTAKPRSNDPSLAA